MLVNVVSEKAAGTSDGFWTDLKIPQLDHSALPTEEIITTLLSYDIQVDIEKEDSSSCNFFRWLRIELSWSLLATCHLFGHLSDGQFFKLEAVYTMFRITYALIILSKRWNVRCAMYDKPSSTLHRWEGKDLNAELKYGALELMLRKSEYEVQIESSRANNYIKMSDVPPPAPNKC